MKEKVFLAKGIRRVLSLMFCLAVCLILMPMTASAATDATPITQVSIRGMERLYAGESTSIADLKKLITVSTTSSSTEVSDAVTVNTVRWIDVETEKAATEIVEGHKYRLLVYLTTNVNYNYFKADETDPKKFDGRVYMYLSSSGASPYSVERADKNAIYVQSQEMTALPPAFTTQPVGGTSEPGKPFTVHFEAGSSKDTVYLDYWSGAAWGRLAELGIGVRSYDIPNKYESGSTRKFRLRINNGANRYVYSDEFEVTWGADIFTKQPVGGVCLAGESYTVTFSHAVTSNRVTLEYYYNDKWVYMRDVPIEATSYDISGAVETPGTTRKYRLGIKNGAGQGEYVYSDPFEVKWVAEDYVDITHMALIDDKATKTGDNFYTVYIERGKSLYLDYRVYGIKIGETVAHPTYYGGITGELFLTVPSSTRTIINTTDTNQYFKVYIGADETLDQILYYVYPTENKSAGIWLNVIVDSSFSITYDANGGSFTKTLDETVPLSRSYQLPDYRYVTPPFNKLFKCWEYDGKEYRPGELITLNPDCNQVKAIYTYDPFSNQSGDITITCNNMETQKLIVFNLRNIGEIEKAVLEWDSTSSNGVFVRASGSLDLTEEVKSKYVHDDIVKYHSIEVQPYMVGVCRITVTMNGVPYYGKTFRIKTDPNCHVHDTWHSKGNYYEECYSVCSVCGGDNIYQLHNWEFLGITDYPTETTSGETYYRCTYCDQRKSVSYDGYFTLQPKSIYNKNEGAETNCFAVSVPINGWTIEIKENNTWKPFISEHAEEAHAAGDVIEFTCGYAGVVWPDAKPYRIKVTVDNNGIFYSEPFVVTEAIKSVEISDLDKPVIDETLDYNVAIKTTPSFSSAIASTEISWYTINSRTQVKTKISNTAKANTRDYYSCEIILTPGDGYGFEKTEDGSYVNVISCSWGKAKTQVDAGGKLHITFGPVAATEAVTQYSISGNITPAGAETDDITIQLYDQNGINRLDEVVVAGSAASYAFNNVAPGTYTLNVSAPGCAIATTQITVSDGNVVKDITMYLNQKLSHTLSVQNNLAINYYVAQSAIPNLTNVALSIEKDVYDTGAKTIEKTVLPSKLGDYGYGPEHKFVYEGVASYQAINEIRASLTGEYNDVKYTFAPDVYSIETYCYNQIGKSSVAAKTKKLLVDLLNYCSASQVHFGIKADTLANRNLTSAQKALGTTTAPALNNISGTKTLDGATARFNGKTLVLGNNVELKIYVLLDDSVQKENVSLRIKYQNVNGENVVAYVPYSEFSYDSGRNEYSAKYTGLIAPEFRKELQLTVMEGTKEISDTDTYAIETYAYNRVNGSSNQTLKDVVTEMMKYSDSALAYFN